MSDIDITITRLARRKKTFKTILVAYLIFLAVYAVYSGVANIKKTDFADPQWFLFAIFVYFMGLGIACIPLLGLLIWGLVIFKSLRKRFLILVVVVSLLVSYSIYVVISLLRTPL
jgi:hypothetical protein